MARGEGLRQVSELPGDLGVRSRARRPTVRVLRLVPARAVPTGQGGVQPRVAAAVRGPRAARPGARPRVVRAAVAPSPQPEYPRPPGYATRPLPALLDRRPASAPDW